MSSSNLLLKFILVYFFVVFTFTGEKCRKDSKPSTDSKTTETSFSNSKGINLNYEFPASQLVLSFERTACFGRCPIYKVDIYANGSANYK